MTWYAHHVFAQPTNKVVSALSSIPGFDSGIYFVPHLKDLETTEQVTGAILFGDGEKPSQEILRSVRHGPKVPPGGLIVVRELCGGGADDSCRGWFEDEGILWDRVSGDENHGSDSFLDLPALFRAAPDWWIDVAPPIRVLKALKEIALSTKTVVAYYASHMWGGDVECAFGWVWDGERGTSHFYRGVTSVDDKGIERTGFFTDLTGAIAIDPNGRRFIANGDVLTLMLLHFGLMLSDGYFELHTRAFPWEKYKTLNVDG